MAERLTESEVSKSFTEQELRTSEQARIYQKLGELEDIIEKYGIESVEELNQMLDWLFTLSGQDADDMKFIARDKKLIHQQYCDIKTDRDTWQKACELACKHIAEVEWLSCPETDDIKESENEIRTLTKQSLNYFYQQAKKENNNV